MTCERCGRRLFIVPGGYLACEDWQCGGLRGSHVNPQELRRLHPELVIRGRNWSYVAELMRRATA